MRYRFMQQHQGHYPVTLMGRVLEVSRSGYYRWLQRSEGQRARANKVLLEHIVAVHRQEEISGVR